MSRLKAESVSQSELATKPQLNAAALIPLPTDEDGWIDCDDDEPIVVAKPDTATTKRLDSKALIQRKLAERKRKAQEEAERNTQKERKPANQSNLNILVPSESYISHSSDAGQSIPESDRILNDLFEQFNTQQSESGTSQAQDVGDSEMGSQAISKPSEMLNEGPEASQGEERKRKKKKKDKDKKSKKDKKEKKTKKSKYNKDPELDQNFIEVPSPNPHKSTESAESTNKHDTSVSSTRRKRSRSPLDRSKHKRSSDHEKRRDKERERESDRERRRDGRSDSRERHRTRDRYRESRSSRNFFRRSHSRSREREITDELPFFIDKEKLRRIAIKRVAQMQAAGKSVYAAGVTPEDIAQISSGGASISELTSFCRSMARDSDSESDDEVLNTPCTAEENDTSDMLQPFSRAAAIVMNIRNAKQRPIQTAEEKSKLRSSFPVSSGTHHRKEEPNEWTPVPVSNQPKKVFEEAGSDADDVEDISVLINRRLNAVKKLKRNPNDKQIKANMEDLDKQTAKWSESKNLPGAFTGRVDAKMLTPDELAPSADKRQQAWVRKETLLRARPVQGGIGQFLLQKMGWSEGQGLGKQNDGQPEPLQLDFNTSRKGLTAPEERPNKNVDSFDQVVTYRGSRKSGRGGLTATPVFSLAEKHPVSLLMELCSRRKWQSPQFVVLHESGPPHKKNFIMQVTVNGNTYQPSIASNNKKLAKTHTATVALQAMGLLPSDSSPAQTASEAPAVPTHATPPVGSVAPMIAVRPTPPIQVLRPPQPPPPPVPIYQPPPTFSTLPHIDFSSFR
ncbi:protein SON-like isoform X2 [Watersipora subatra]|uniref:protein SON-like isoform X2 n=1 Tax=Watersipora subatra TaxID=2589382 RepID=UPI00355C6CF1